MTWLGVGLTACGPTADVTMRGIPVEAVRVDGDIQAALARFESARVLGSEAGVPHLVTGDLGRLPSEETVGALRARDALGEALTRIAPVFRVRSEDLVYQRTHKDERGHRHLRFQQTLDGLRVVGGELILHADEAGLIYAVNGSARTGQQVSAEVRVAPEAARMAAVSGSSALHASAEGPAQRVYLLPEHGQEPLLAYEVRVKGEREGIPAEDLVYVDARRGDLLLVNPLIHTALSRQMHHAYNTRTQGPIVREEGQPPTGDVHVDTNYERLAETYNCYHSLFGRDSFDNAGAMLISTVHYDSGYVNAFWDGTQMVYGDGDDSLATMLGLDSDVTTHELTHAVTHSESNLVYQGEPGALNESLSDIFASVCESWGRGWSTDEDVYKLAEDVWTPSIAGDALRYLDDPFKDGISRDHYDQYYIGVDVHYLSGISNLAFSLLSKGGTHPRGKTNNLVPAIGMEKAGRIFYKASTDFFTSTTTFEEARLYTLLAAEQLHGANSPEVFAVHEAWAAVGVAPPSVVTELSNNVPLTELSGDSDTRTHYRLEVPEGQSSLVFEMSGGTGDADMYVRYGTPPTTTTFDCSAPDHSPNWNNESCPVSPQAGTWYVMLHGYKARPYAQVTLKGTYATGFGRTTTVTTNGRVASGKQIQLEPYKVRAGTKFKVKMLNSRGDPNLFVRFGAPPTSSTYDCGSRAFSVDETCDLTVPADQNSAYIMIEGSTMSAADAIYALTITYTRI